LPRTVLRPGISTAPAVVDIMGLENIKGSRIRRPIREIKTIQGWFCSWAEVVDGPRFQNLHIIGMGP
jgi:hypothetical protein